MRAVRSIALIALFILVGLEENAFGFFIGFKPWKLPSEYIFTETHGTVIDAETKKPIEGLIVVGMWKLEWTRGPTYISEAIVIKLIHVEEAVTDAKGCFTLPAPSPIKRPKYWGFNGRDPEILFFKPGYKIDILSNSPWISSWAPNRKKYTYSKNRKSYWDKKTIDLEPFRIGRKIPIKNRDYSKERILRYDTATQEMWEWDLYEIVYICKFIEEADKKRDEGMGIPIEFAPYIETHKVKNLLRVFSEERKKVSKPFRLRLPQRFEDYIQREIGHEK